MLTYAFGRFDRQRLVMAGRAAMDGLMIRRTLPEPEAGRVIALAWRSTDPRGPGLRRLVAMLRPDLPEGVAAVA